MTNLSDFTSSYQHEIDDVILKYTNTKTSQYLLDPIQYIINNGGKKIRPIVLLLSAKINNGDDKEAIKAAASIELFHIFSLVHDDIMDKDEFRRGKQTIHKKWDDSVAILSGDGLLAISNIIMTEVQTHNYKSLMTMYAKTFFDVCAGQAYDKEFESKDTVSIDEYIHMIGLKTSALLGASSYIGSLLGNTTGERQQQFYDFGYNLGLAFQIQDDILDLFSDQTTLGKDVASDVYNDKKSILTIYAKEQNIEYSHLLKNRNEETIKVIQSVFRENGVLEKSIKLRDEYSNMAHQFIDSLDSSNEKNLLLELVDKLNNRIS